MDAVLDYAKFPVTVQSYARAQYNSKAMRTPSGLKDTIRATATSSTSEGVSGLNINYDENFTLHGKFYPLKAFVPEEIYLGELPKVFWGSRREKKMGISLKPDEKNKNWRDNNCVRITVKAAATKADTKL